MNDRVRIYELSRRMNVPNQELIKTLRELGYDVKSHSSTVDSNTVGLLIAAMGKKKGDIKESAEAAPAAKKASKADAPEKPKKAKPRVLSRYRPKKDGTGETQLPITPGGAAGQTTQSPPGVTQAQPAATPAADRTTETQAPAAETTQAPAAKQAAQEQQPAAAAEAKQTAPPEEKEKEKDAAREADKDEKAAEAPEPASKPQSVRPMSPSVPIRIAAPSVRATPPRPPKSHRRGPSERHSQKEKEEKRQAAAAVEIPTTISITKTMSVQELAKVMCVPATEVIKALFIKGIMRTVNQTVELELAKELAVEMGYELAADEEKKAAAPKQEEKELTEEELKALVDRPPVVTIMGHVDHGKTSLLDAIRQTKFQITDAEHGGITQHIGAYHVEVPGEDGAIRQIVFLDTPGHEAFTAMRARGASGADVAILVVAADDGVMPQTIEAIDHAKAAAVPIIVAVNKIDKAGSDPDRVLTQLMEHEVVPDSYGGDTVTVKVSATKRTGLDELLEMILLVADMQELKANPEVPATGVIVEAELTRGRGAVATALVQNGTLREGDFLVAGSRYGRVRALFDDRGERVKMAGPSMPVEVLGLDEVPQAGDSFTVVSDVQTAKETAESRKLQESDRRQHRVSLESLHDMLEQGEVKALNVIVKADVDGTAEAIADQVRKLTSNEVTVNVVRTATGEITETDVNLAASSDAIIVGFNVQPDQNANRIKDEAGVDIRTYNIIYQITEDLEKAIQGLIEPEEHEVQIGTAEIRQLFKSGKNLTIGGCMVTSGKIQRNAKAKIEREGQIVYEGKIETLKRFKDDAKEVAQGYECGMSFEKFNDIQEKDLVHAFVIQTTKREPTR